MTKFKVGDKVRIISNLHSSVNQVGEIGVLTVVTDVDARVHVEGRKNLANWHTLEEIELITPKQTKSQRIAALEAEAQRQDERILDLERKVAELSAKPAPLTSNEQRKAIIAEAKAFVESAKNFTGVITKRRGYKYAQTGYIACDVEFVVNADKRTVVAILKEQMDARVLAKGIAKAHPDDVFNADIGKAIALGRALGLVVKRFEKSVQPTEVVVGMTVHYFRKKDGTFSFDHVITLDSDEITAQNDITGADRYYNAHIADDTEAQY